LELSPLSSDGNFPFQTAPPDGVFRAGSSNLETLAAQRQLAWILAGTYKPPRRIETGIPTRFNRLKTHFRSPDVIFTGGYSELKFAGDRVNREDARMDVWLQEKGFKVRYDIVPHPFTGKVTPTGDQVLLKALDLSFKKWGLEFWRLGRGAGAKIPLTWTTKKDLQPSNWNWCY
jgi:hypothetical protein